MLAGYRYHRGPAILYNILYGIFIKVLVLLRLVPQGLRGGVSTFHGGRLPYLWVKRERWIVLTRELLWFIEGCTAFPRELLFFMDWQSLIEGYIYSILSSVYSTKFSRPTSYPDIVFSDCCGMLPPPRAHVCILRDGNGRHTLLYS